MPQKKLYNRKKLAESSENPAVAKELKNIISNQSKKVSNNEKALKREIVFIKAPYNIVWQSLVKYCILNNYQIIKSKMREGLLRCDISTHVTNYFMNSTPNAIKKFTTSSEKLAGIALWHLQMDIFVTPGKDKTMVEFIPRYYEILAKEKGAKKVLISNGKFEKDAIEFVKNELKRLNY